MKNCMKIKKLIEKISFSSALQLLAIAAAASLNDLQRLPDWPLFLNNFNVTRL